MFYKRRHETRKYYGVSYIRPEAHSSPYQCYPKAREKRCLIFKATMVHTCDDILKDLFCDYQLTLDGLDRVNQRAASDWQVLQCPGLPQNKTMATVNDNILEIRQLDDLLRIGR